jgi:hypothetical protein
LISRDYLILNRLNRLEGGPEKAGVWRIAARNEDVVSGDPRPELSKSLDRDFRSVHDQVSRSGLDQWAVANDRSVRSHNFAEFFAELRAERAPKTTLDSFVLR